MTDGRPAGERPATREEVVGCYRFILGREPEDAAVVEQHLANGLPLRALRRTFLESFEFQRGTPPPPLAAIGFAPPRLEVEAEASPEQLGAVLQRVGAYWTRIGGEAPHWSVLTHDRFRPDRIAEEREAFYATGRNDRALLLGLMARHGLSPASHPRLLEFGCGVGRATLAIAEGFAEVTACDISEAHLALAREAEAERGPPRIAWFRSTIEAPMPDGQWDVWFSRLVLQHNPPPVTAWLLRRAFQGLAPGGIAVFQVPVHCIGYRYSLAEDLAATTPPRMEMHVLPQHEIFALAAAAGVVPVDVREDTHVISPGRGNWLSNLFVLRKPG